MSTVSSVGGYGQELLQMLQNFKLQKNDPSTAKTQALQPAARLAKGLSNRSEKFENEVGSFGEASGLDSDDVAALKQDVHTAIDNALQNANGSQDPRELVKSAVESTLQSYGLDASAFEAQLQKNAPAPPAFGAPGAALGGAGQANGDSGSTSPLLGLLNGKADSSGILSSLSLVDMLA
ncbi:MAG TPA: hypothetical protein P5572_03850 [Phycisphaerae bacterium]|nr:hypothetical protein [Phycisphaerae bacterium]